MYNIYTRKVSFQGVSHLHVIQSFPSLLPIFLIFFVCRKLVKNSARKIYQIHENQ